MSNLPFTLPTCDQPAAMRIEVFTPAPDGSGSSLDAVVYTCAEHADQALTAIRTAGLNAYRAPGVRTTRTCGHVHIFPTGTLAGDDQHPRWCDRQDCERRAEHRSEAMHVDTNRPEAAILDVALIQSLHPLAEPMVSMTVIEGPVAQHVVLSIGQARVLRYRLGNLIDLRKGGAR